jgi:hypothetical protein
MRPSNAIQIDPLWWQGLGPHQSGLHEIQDLKASSEHPVARYGYCTARPTRHQFLHNQFSLAGEMTDESMTAGLVVSVQ